MTSLADRTIAALRAEHEATVTLVRDLTDEQLVEASGAAEWTVAAVLSHLGSAAVITLAGVQSALGAGPPPEAGFNESVWDLWNAMTPAAQRAGYLEHDAKLVAAFQALDDQQRESLELQVGFLPAPLSVAAFAGMRLHESAQHSWDVRVPGEPAAVLLPGSASVLAELFSGELAFLLGFFGKADLIAGPVRLEIVGSGYGLSIADSVALGSNLDHPTASFRGPLEAALRLIAGRLGPTHTPGDLTVTGNVTLEDLRTAFPGL
ncbi:MAG: maleylpyruvate isomerase family mycothiol-dependent enzyme [Jatrophihabitantaceae bacterium]